MRVSIRVRGLHLVFFSLGHFSLLFDTFWSKNLYFVQFLELKFAICTVHGFFHGLSRFSMVFIDFPNVFIDFSIVLIKLSMISIDLSIVSIDLSMRHMHLVDIYRSKHIRVGSLQGH